MICVSLDERYPVDFLKRLDSIDFAEIRMDRMVLTPEDIADIFSQPLTLIATCRSGILDDQQRKDYLIAAIEAGAGYVDIEVKSDIEYRRAIIGAARSKKCKIIVSFHDFYETPEDEGLRQIVTLCLSEGADIAKIACKVNSVIDSSRLLGLLGQKDFKDRLVVVGMGEKGKITRIVSPLLGSLFTYASFSEGVETADGQIEMARLEEIIELLKMDRTNDSNKSNKSDMSYTTYRSNKESTLEKRKIFAVTGNPILHSRSPEIFNAAFGLLSIDAVYTRFAASRVEDIITGVSDIGLSGFNVTSPFKEEILPFLDNIEELAQRIGAVNTVLVDRGKLHGFNTDIKGVKDALSFNGVETEGKRVLILGAGGAAKAAACALISEGANVIIANRTFEKAKAISDDLGCKAVKMGDINEALKHSDIVISCLPSTDRIIKPEFLKKGMAIFDANYGMSTALVEDGKKRGCTIIDGREWLLFQGVAAFRHFIGTEPPTEIMREAVYRQNVLSRKNIAFIGFMGTGKTTIAQGAAKLMAMPCIDIDKQIEQKAGLSIPEIFETKGEKAFRQMETKEIAKISNFSNTIISCGGGAVLERANRDMLRKNCIVIWLWANVDTVFKRVGMDNGRPLLRDLNKKSDIKKMLDGRIPVYASTSDMLICTDNLSPDEIIRKIYGETGKFLKN